jgi:hypothetical protein
MASPSYGVSTLGRDRLDVEPRVVFVAQRQSDKAANVTLPPPRTRVGTLVGPWAIGAALLGVLGVVAWFASAHAAQRRPAPATSCVITAHGPLHLDGCDLRGADLGKVDLRRASLRGARLDGVQLQRHDLRGVEASGGSLAGALLSGAQLDGADLEGADLRGADLRRTCLRGADLRGANLSQSSLGEADLAGADLVAAQLTGAVPSPSPTSPASAVLASSWSTSTVMVPNRPMLSLCAGEIACQRSLLCWPPLSEDAHAHCRVPARGQVPRSCRPDHG